MKKNTQQILIWMGIGLGAYVLYRLYAAATAIVTAPVNAAKSALQAGAAAAGAVGAAVGGAVSAVTDTAGQVGAAVGNVPSDIAAAASIPGLEADSLNLDQQIIASQSTYAPGGAVYNQTLATKGQAAADAQWAAVQANDANMKAQEGQPFSLFNPSTWP